MQVVESLSSPPLAQVESFWLSDNLPSGAVASASSAAPAGAVSGSGLSAETGTGVGGDVEMPWWAYGPRGMQLWFPSSLSDPLTPRQYGGQYGAQAHDIELEFDQEVSFAPLLSAFGSKSDWTTGRTAQEGRF